MTEEDHTEKILEALYEGLVDKLNGLPKGDPSILRVTADVVAAWRELKDYRKNKKKK